MRILLVGGTGFIGRHVAREPLAPRPRRRRVPPRPRPAAAGAREVLGDRARIADRASEYVENVALAIALAATTNAPLT